MTVSVGSSFIIALVIIVALAIFIAVVVIADRRPHFKNPKPPENPTGVTGGIHEGDPRSVAPRRDEPVEPVEPPRKRR